MEVTIMQSELRLKGEDTVIDMVLKMSEGNPGAMTFLMNLIEESKYGGALGAYGQILLLDSIGLYADKAYMLWNDCCDKSIEQTELVLRNFQMGHLSKEEIHQNLSQCRAQPFTNLKTFEEMGLTPDMEKRE